MLKQFDHLELNTSFESCAVSHVQLDIFIERQRVLYSHLRKHETKLLVLMDQYFSKNVI